MIKGIAGHGYYDRLVVPIIENTARECDLADRMAAAIEAHPATHAVLVRRTACTSGVATGSTPRARPSATTTCSRPPCAWRSSGSTRVPLAERAGGSRSQRRGEPSKPARVGGVK